MRIETCLGVALAWSALSIGCSQTSGIANGGNGDLGASASDASTAPDLATPANVVDLAIPAASGDLASQGPPPLPQIPYNNGPVVTAPLLVTITWKGDPLESTLQAFDAWIVTSPYFVQSLAEYNVHAGTQMSWSIATPAGPTMSDDDISKLIQSLIVARSIPAPTVNTVYNVYPPSGTTVTVAGGNGMSYQSCTQILSYHQVGPSVAGTPTVYAVNPRCTVQGLSDLDYVTYNSSGVLAAVVTDPTGFGWYAGQSIPYAPLGGDVSTLCQSFYFMNGGHLVSGIYSNSSAAAGMRPCLPAPQGPMFAAPATPEVIQAKAGSTTTVMLRIWGGTPMPAAPLQLTTQGWPTMQVTTKAAPSLVNPGDMVRLDITLDPSLLSQAQGVAYIRLDSADYHWENQVLIYVQ